MLFDHLSWKQLLSIFFISQKHYYITYISYQQQSAHLDVYKFTGNEKNHKCNPKTKPNQHLKKKHQLNQIRSFTGNWEAKNKAKLMTRKRYCCNK
jgi:hypothetical protein